MGLGEEGPARELLLTKSVRGQCGGGSFARAIAMTTRQADLLKGTRRCLKCGKLMWADRCHRICIPCSHVNEAILDDRTRVAHELRPWVRSLVCSEGDLSFTASSSTLTLSLSEV